jgi:hypothetical protein
MKCENVYAGMPLIRDKEVVLLQERGVCFPVTGFRILVYLRMVLVFGVYVGALFLECSFI